jgi:hypothetical protein
VNLPMSSVPAPATSAIARSATARSRSEIAGVSTSLLPAPGAGGMSGTEDALSMMYSLVAKQGEITQALGQDGAQNTKKIEDINLSQEASAEAQQAQAEANQGGFWNDILSVVKDIGEIAGAVAAAAATVFTCGAAGVAVVAVAAVLLSAGAVVSATHCLGKDSAYFGLGMEVAGSIMTMGATSGTVATTALTEVAQTVGTVAQVTSGAAAVVGGIATVKIAKFESESEDAAADVQQAVNAINQQSRMMSELIDGMKTAAKSNQNALQIIAGAAHTCGQTSVIAASGGKA